MVFNAMQSSLKRYFVLSSGRAGSTLCASLFTAAGANFGCGTVGEWDVRAGAFEHKESTRVAQYNERGLELKSYSHRSRWAMYRRKYHRAMAKKNTKSLMEKAEYAKTSSSAIIKLAKTLGYEPTVLLLYRSFNDYALSGFLRSGRNYSQMLEHYYQTYSTGLIALQIYGGCVIHYDEIADTTNNEWIDRVCEVSSLDRQKLIAARDVNVRSHQPSEPFCFENEQISSVEKAIQYYSNRVILPHRLVERKA